MNKIDQKDAELFFTELLEADSYEPNEYVMYIASLGLDGRMFYKLSWFKKKRLIKKLNKLRPRTFIKLDKNNVPHLVTRMGECEDVEKYVRNLSAIIKGK